MMLIVLAIADMTVCQEPKCTKISAMNKIQKTVDSCEGDDSCQEIVFTSPRIAKGQVTTQPQQHKGAKYGDKNKQTQQPKENQQQQLQPQCHSGIYCHEDEWSIQTSCNFVDIVSGKITCWCSVDPKTQVSCYCESDTPIIDAMDSDIACPNSGLQINITRECWIVLKGSQINRMVYMSVAVSQSMLLAFIFAFIILSGEVREEFLFCMVIISRSLSIFFKDDVVKISVE